MVHSDLLQSASFSCMVILRIDEISFSQEVVCTQIGIINLIVFKIFKYFNYLTKNLL